MSRSPTPAGSVRSALGLLLACGLVLACAEPAEVPSPREQPEGHRRMVATLARIAAESEIGNAFVGRSQPAELKAQLALLQPGVPDLRRWLWSRQLAKHELRLGHNAEAVEAILQAYAELERFRDQIPLDESMGTILEVGVAHLRKGEVLNCIHRHSSESCILPIRGGGVHVDRAASTEAARYFREILERTEPDSWWHIKAIWLYNIARMTLGEWPDQVEEAYRIDPAVFESGDTIPRFREIAPALGMNSFDMSGGAIAEDFDGDGRLDVLFSTSDPAGPLKLFWNHGDGSFAEGAAEAGLGGINGGLNMVQADYDNDGDRDVLVLRGAWWRQYGQHPNSLLRNNGDRTFTDVTYDAGLADVSYPTQGGAWADYDLDGDVDLFLGNESSRELTAPSQLFRNEGDGTFVDVAAQAGVTNERYAKAAAWGDYDGDRDPDLYVSNNGHKNRLYRNNGDGTFTDVAEQLEVWRPVASFPTWFFDYDNDGALDLLAFGYGGPGYPPDVGFVAASYLGLPTKADRARLYRGDGKGGFREVGVEAGLQRISHPMAANFGDLDNDGFLDLYLGTGYPYYEGLMPNVMYRNREGREFADVTTVGGFGHLQKGHGIAFADLDNDGDQDVVAQIGGMYTGDEFWNAVFENPGFPHHWIKISLVGKTSNRAGIGARLTLHLRGDGAERRIHRRVGTGGSFGGNPLRQEIGLGPATRVERLEVYWPASDTSQRFDEIAADQWIEIVEGEQDYRPRLLEPMQLGG